MRKLERFSTNAVRTRRLATCECINNVTNIFSANNHVYIIFNILKFSHNGLIQQSITDSAI